MWIFVEGAQENIPKRLQFLARTYHEKNNFTWISFFFLNTHFPDYIIIIIIIIIIIMIWCFTSLSTLSHIEPGKKRWQWKALCNEAP